MGTARSLLFTISSILMILAGAGSLVCAVLLAMERLRAPDSSLPLTLITAILMLIFSILNIFSGIHGVRFHNKRINSAVVIRLPGVSIAFCLAAVVLTLFNGILMSYLLSILLTGILIPLLFIYASARKSYL